MAVGLAEALIWGLTIEQAAAVATIERARQADGIARLSELVRGALVADLPEAASACIDLLQAAAVDRVDPRQSSITSDAWTSPSGKMVENGRS